MWTLSNCSYLAAVDVLDGSLSEKEVDVVALGHRTHKIRSCQSQWNRIRIKLLLREQN